MPKKSPNVLRLDSLDLSNSKQKWLQLTELLKCSCCSKSPGDDPKLLSHCGHSLCSACARQSKIGSSGGVCPVQGCGIHVPASDCETDRILLKRLDALSRIHMALQGEVYNKEEPVPITRKQSSTSRKTVNNKKKASPRGVEPKRNAKCTLNKNAKINKKNAKGETQLHVACIKGDLPRVLDLLDQGAQANTQDHAGWTPLHEAVQNGFLEIVEALVTNGATVNVPGGEDLDTPLHEAASNGFHEIATFLVLSGAKKEARNADGKTPMEVACDDQMAQLILNNDQGESETQNLEHSIVEMSHCQEGITIFFDNLGGGDEAKYLDPLKTHPMKELNIKVEKNMNETVTHLVYKESILDRSSLAYFTGLLNGSWIVHEQWLIQALEHKMIPVEREFLVGGTKSHLFQAPLKSIENRVRKYPKLFQGFHIFLQNEFSSPCKAEVSKMLTIGGAVVLTREPNPETIDEERTKKPFHVSESSGLSKCAHLIIYQEGTAEPMVKYNMEHIKSLPLSWIFKCIHNFKILDQF